MQITMSLKKYFIKIKISLRKLPTLQKLYSTTRGQVGMYCLFGYNLINIGYCLSQTFHIPLGLLRYYSINTRLLVAKLSSEQTVSGEA